VIGLRGRRSLGVEVSGFGRHAAAVLEEEDVRELGGRRRMGDGQQPVSKLT
jgi:hypothetical protein